MDFRATILAAILLAPMGFAEQLPDHLAGGMGMPEAGALLPNTVPGKTRQQVLEEGLREAKLSPQALQALERSFKNTPRLAPEQFEKTLAQLNGPDGALLKGEQIDGLKKLFKENLAGVNGEPGKELTNAVRAVLKQPAAAQQKIDPNDPEVKKLVDAQLAKAVPAQEEGALNFGDLLAQQTMLGMMKELLGDKKGDDEGRMEPMVQQPQMPTHRDEPTAAERAAEARERERDRRREDQMMAQMNRGNRGYMPPPSSESKKEPTDDKKPEKKESNWTPPPKREKEAPEKDTKKDTTADANSLMDALKNTSTAKDLGPKKLLNPLAQGGPGGFPGGPGGGPMGGPGMGGMGGMMGGFGGGGGFSGGSSFMDGSVFGSVGQGSMAFGPSAPGSSNLMRDGGYSGANGGGSFEGGDGVGFGDSFGVAVLWGAFADQIDMTPGRKHPGQSILEQYVGWAGRDMCLNPENAKAVSFCEGLEARKSHNEFIQRLRAISGQS